MDIYKRCSKQNIKVNIRLYSNNYNKPVTNSRDTQEIPREEGEIMMNIFENYRYQTSILQHFQYYDQRQELFEKSINK